MIFPSPSGQAARRQPAYILENRPASRGDPLRQLPALLRHMGREHRV